MRTIKIKRKTPHIANQRGAYRKRCAVSPHGADAKYIAWMSCDNTGTKTAAHIG